MPFVLEEPTSQAIIDRFNWRAMPMFERGEASPCISPPLTVIVDDERDLIFAGGWGGYGRTSGEWQSATYIYLRKGVVIPFMADRYKMEIVNKDLPIEFKILKSYYRITRLCVPVALKGDIESIKSELAECFPKEKWFSGSDLYYLDEISDDVVAYVSINPQSKNQMNNTLTD